MCPFEFPLIILIFGSILFSSFGPLGVWLELRSYFGSLTVSSWLFRRDMKEDFVIIVWERVHLFHFLIWEADDKTQCCYALRFGHSPAWYGAEGFVLCTKSSSTPQDLWRSFVVISSKTCVVSYKCNIISHPLPLSGRNIFMYDFCLMQMRVCVCEEEKEKACLWFF